MAYLEEYGMFISRPNIRTLESAPDLVLVLHNARLKRC